MLTEWWSIGLVIAGLAALAVSGRWLGGVIFGPLFPYELLRLARRGMHPRLRVVLTSLLLVGLLVTYLRTFPRTDMYELLFGGNESADQARLQSFGETFLYAFLIVQQAVVLLVTPVYAGGAIAEEKERSGMDFLLTSQLTRWELVAGKLAARLAFVLASVAAGLPVLLLTLLFGAVSIDHLLAGFAVTMVTAVAVGSFAVMLSVYRHTLRDVLLWCYAVLGLLSVFGVCFSGCYPQGGMFSPVGILWVLISLWVDGSPVVWDPTWSLVGKYSVVYLGFSVLFFLLACRSVRTRLRDEPSVHLPPPLVPPEVVDEPPTPLTPNEPPLPDWYQLPQRKVFPDGEAPPLFITGRPFVVPRLQPDDDPLLWKERHFSSRLPFLEAQWITMFVTCGTTCFLFVLCVGLFVAVFTQLNDHMWISKPVNVSVRIFLIVAVNVVPVIGIRTAMSLGEERGKQTLTTLLTLPIPRRDILWAKVKGAAIRTRWVFLGIGVALLLGFFSGGTHPIGVLGAAALVAGYGAFAAMLGLWLAARSTTSVRAVLALIAIMLVSLIGPLLIGPLVEAVWGIRVWSESLDLFSPPLGIWYGTDMMLSGQLVSGGSSLRARELAYWQSWFLYGVGLFYAVVGAVLWLATVYRFEREGRR
jgi:ABC-type transport system involved in multi-copper enzyme maturation permease subunit